MSGDLVRRLAQIGRKTQISCPDGVEGCLVYHYRIETDPTCVEAISRIEQLEAALKKIAQHDMQAIAMDALRPGERIRKALEGENLT